MRKFNGFLKTIGTCDFEVTKRGESSLILSANLMSYHAQNTTIFRISNILLHHGTRNKTKLIHPSPFKLFTQVYGKTAVVDHSFPPVPLPRPKSFTMLEI